MMSKSAIKVLLRTRPTEASPDNALQFPADRKTIAVSVPSKGGSLPSLVPATLQQYQFKFDNVLHNATQEEMFEACAAEALQNVWTGINSTIMCYGQTGAGKTYTMTGGRKSYSQRGLVPRVLSQLFQEVRSRTDRLVTVQVCYLEIYNELLYDLLELTTQPQDVTIHEDGRGRVRLQGLRCCEVTSEAQALQLLFEGETNRVIGEHQLNRESSRSHSIFTITLRSQPAPGSEDYGTGASGTVAKLHLVDLAGSERVCKTKSDGQLLKEAGHINKSLSILEQVIMALGEKGREHVPYRSSKLTHVLRDSLGGNCATTLVANVWADPAQLDETLSTCRFAQRMTRVTCEISANVVQDTSSRARQLERELAELRQELAMHDAIAGRSSAQYSPYSAAQRAQLRGQVLQFLQAGDSSEGDGSSSIEPLQLLSVRHMLEMLAMCKTLYREHGVHGHSSSAAGTAGRSTAGVGSSTGGRQQREQHVGPGYVGDVEDDSASQSGGVGVAPDDCRPGSVPTSEEGAGVSSTRGGSAGSMGSAMPSGKEEAWAEYKATEGRTVAEALTQNKLKLVQLKRTSKERAVSINGIKRKLDDQTQQAQQLQTKRLQEAGDPSSAAAAEPEQDSSSSSSSAAVMGPEELAAVQRVQQLKAQYRDQYNELQMLKSEVAYTQQLVDQCSQQLLMGFDEWYQSRYGSDKQETSEPCSPSSSFRQKDRAGALATARSASSASRPEEDIDYASMDPEAAAYVKAQQKLYHKLHGPAPPPGAIKAQRQKPGSYFGSGERAKINDMHF